MLEQVMQQTKKIMKNRAEKGARIHERSITKELRKHRHQLGTPRAVDDALAGAEVKAEGGADADADVGADVGDAVGLDASAGSCRRR